MIDNKKFKNKYRIKSSRLQTWDYRWKGSYFITICTHNKNQYFGKISDGKMLLSPTGVLADVFWYEIKNHTLNIKLGEYVVMPNHVHGILLLDKDTNNDSISLNNVKQNEKMESISPKKGSISAVIRSYKSAVSKHAKRLGFEFSWQSRFYDHIIRNEESYRQIEEYIQTNPKKWENDKFYVATRHM